MHLELLNIWDWTFTWNNQWLNSASCFRKKLALWYLTEPQVRKIRYITDNKGTSKLTERRIQQSVKHSRRRFSRRGQRLKSANLTQETQPQTGSGYVSGLHSSFLTSWSWGMVTVLRPLYTVNPPIIISIYTGNHLHQVNGNEAHLKH